MAIDNICYHFVADKVLKNCLWPNLNPQANDSNPFRPVFTVFLPVEIFFLDCQIIIQG